MPLFRTRSPPFASGSPLSLLIAIYLTLVIVLPLALSCVVSYRALPRSPLCPLCGEETLLVRSRSLGLISRLFREQDLQRRWCASCLWEGTARVPLLDTPRRHDRGSRKTAGEPARSANKGPSPSGEAISLRDLEIDGLCWRVLLQTWHDSGHWFGRLLFIAPSGRLWIDDIEPIHGASAREIMGKAQALPDRTLAYRLKELISD